MKQNTRSVGFVHHANSRNPAAVICAKSLSGRDLAYEIAAETPIHPECSKVSLAVDTLTLAFFLALPSTSALRFSADDMADEGVRVLSKE
jgi:hypothetical protein